MRCYVLCYLIFCIHTNEPSLRGPSRYYMWTISPLSLSDGSHLHLMFSPSGSFLYPNTLRFRFMYYHSCFSLSLLFRSFVFPFTKPRNNHHIVSIPYGGYSECATLLALLHMCVRDTQLTHCLCVRPHLCTLAFVLTPFSPCTYLREHCVSLTLLSFGC